MAHLKKCFSILLFIPVEVDSAASDDRARFVDVVDLDDAVEVPDSSRAASGSEAAAGQEVEAQHSAQTDRVRLRITFRLVFDKV